MASYFLVGLLLLPFYGIFLLSSGEYAISVGVQGYDNGFIIPYSVFFISFVLPYFIVKKNSVDLKVYIKRRPVSNYVLKNTAFFVFFINFLTLIFFLFVWGSVSIFTSDVGRGEFRASISSGAFFYYWLMKIIIPGVFLFYTIIYLRSTQQPIDRFFYKINLFTIILIGVSTGFKTTFITLLLPILFLFFWDAGFKSLAKVFLVFVGVVLFVYFVISETSDFDLILNLFIQRLFIAQADVSWYVWTLYSSGESFPNYFQSLLSIFGSTILYILTGVDKSNLNEWIYYDYNSLINIIAGLPVSVISDGHNIVGTIFSESLIAFGLIGIVIFPLVSGLFIALVFNSIQSGIVKGKFVFSTLLLTYFSIFIVSWVQGGGLSTIIHISLFFGFLVLYVVVVFISFFSTRFKLR
jgi:hypothetical protein